jgi:hypothetical protein
MSYQINPHYATAVYPTPVFNTPQLAACFGGNDGDALPLDEQGLLRSVETVLFPHSKIELLERVARSSIWRIYTEEYPYEGNYYVDEQFIQLSADSPPRRNINLPSIPQTCKALERLQGTRYIWGGNWPEGVELLSQVYPSRTPFNQLDPLIRDTWQLKGVDCSGLIYYATNGWTLRNSSSLLNFGHSILVKGLSIDEIVEQLQPLDLIVWSGHVVCVLDQNASIESMAGMGVIKRHLRERLMQIIAERQPVDDWKTSDGMRFVIRRWHPDTIS